ncbi:ribokinase [Propionibacteriaceae bacterium G1746]
MVGSLNLDLVINVERQPHPGETILGSGLVTLFGGKGGNQAVAAAASNPTTMVGCVGDDAGGQQYLERLRGFGVDASGVAAVDGVATGTAVIYVDRQGENMIVVAPGANHALQPAHLAALDDLGAGDVVLLQLEIPLDVIAEVVARSKRAGATVIANLAPYADLPQDVLDGCDLIVVNQHERDLMQASGLRHDNVLVTLGADGAQWNDLHVVADAVQVVDTTGAGDAFCGALAAALAQGATRQDALRSATRAGGACATHVGAQPPLPHAGAPRG